MNTDFTIYKTTHSLLEKVVDFFFYVDVPVEVLAHLQEEIIPYPRATLGYFFNHPFLVEQAGKQSSVNFIISRISTMPATVQPQSDYVKIIGVHLKPYALAYFTEQSVDSLPLSLSVNELFSHHVEQCIDHLNATSELTEQFQGLEALLLSNRQDKDLSLISQAVELIENSNGNRKVTDIAKQLGTTTRTLRNHFHQYVGCSPKAYIQLVKLNKSVAEIKNTPTNLTEVSYDNDYFDQAHFIKTIKSITGKTPKILQQETNNFRFLQF